MEPVPHNSDPIMPKKKASTEVAWIRSTGSRRFEFLVTDDELRAFVTDDLPPQFAPYSLLYSTGEKSGKSIQWNAREISVGQVSHLSSEGICQFVLRSDQLTHDWAQDTAIYRNGDTRVPYHQWTAAGLIVIQHHWHSHYGLCERTSLCITPKVVHLPTGNVQVNDAYVTLYNQLTRAWNKRLTCRVGWMYAEGKVQKFKATSSWVEALRRNGEKSSYVVLQE